MQTSRPCPSSSSVPLRPRRYLKWGRGGGQLSAKGFGSVEERPASERPRRELPWRRRGDRGVSWDEPVQPQRLPLQTTDRWMKKEPEPVQRGWGWGGGGSVGNLNN